MSQPSFQELHQLPERELPFSLEEYANRLTSVRQRMAEANIDVLYLTAPESMYYLTGYRACWYGAQGPSSWPQYYGIAVHQNHDKVIHIDIPAEELYIDYISIPSIDKRIIPKRADLSFIVNTLKDEGWLKGTMGMEFGSYRPNRRVSEEMEAAFLNTDLSQVVDATHILREQRRIKSAKEIEYHEKAGEILDAGYQALAREARPGMTEMEAFGILNLAMHKAGGDQAAMPYSFASGSRAMAGGHCLPSNKVMRQGELFGADPCGSYNQYHTNVCRVFSFGEPPKELVRGFNIYAESLKVIESIITPGMTVNTFAEEMRRFYIDAGIWDERHWVGGYEMGIGFCPDWVGEWQFTLGNFSEEGSNDERTLDESFVCNFENVFSFGGIIDTLIIRKDKPLIPSSFDGGIFVVE
jgi:Xaa-Pro aminopeptidase